ncbi:NupC/NupG family nucleoside CNT transporter [Nostocoides sp. F2B08]|uniref:NupC/NupG family nucleoside CNT transporter n=1 Tax=Nostocoides sp. F2B08 TaxID=2653936 RepID=UPI0012635CBE|nr:nucleoside transporter C-terminal domain-containing protein [Tetrasphaera sp. F2B08]KAB7742408.1 NupC/NupG family nucleoside CNT transporter [Tetrasphaera sp. F2B08]
MLDVLWGLAGMVFILALAVLLSTNRRAIRLRTVGAALALQVGFGVLVLFVPAGQTALNAASRAVQAVIDSSRAGIEFLFGPLLQEDALIFAFQVLPVIVFFAALTAVLYHWGVLQKVVEILGGGLARLLGTRQAESVNAAANIFVGQTEAPLVIRPYIPRLTHSGLFAVMVGGLSTVAGSVLVGYSLLGARLDYLIAASFMAAPGALLMAKIVMPETETDAPDDVAAVTSASGARPAQATSRSGGADSSAATVATVDGREGDDADDADDDDLTSDLGYRNVIDAAAGGAADGLRLAATIGAMLLAFISLIALINLILGSVGGLVGIPDLTFELILGYVFAPVMFIIGVPWSEALDAGSYVGQKIVVNEFVAFSNFAPVIESYTAKTQAIVTFALTGFANLGSLGILLGGLGGLAPERRGEIAQLGIRAILAATLANLMSAAIAGILIG